MNQLVAIVEDEADISELIKLHINKAGFRAKEFSSGRDFQEFLKSNMPDLVLLDLMLPDTDGFEICKSIRADNRTKHLPLIMVSAKSEELDRILGLEIGADYYMPKPFSIKELIARIKALLRDSKKKQSSPDTVSIRNILYIDLDNFMVTVSGKSVTLTFAEFNLLKLLARRKGYVFSRDKILNFLWGEDKIVLDRTIDVHIKNLREKLGPAGKFIQNVRGIGYKLDD